jgi:hypothetical protein
MIADCGTLSYPKDVKRAKKNVARQGPTAEMGAAPTTARNRRASPADYAFLVALQPILLSDKLKFAGQLFRASAGVQRRDAARQILERHSFKPSLADHRRELFLIRKPRNRVWKVLVSAA